MFLSFECQYHLLKVYLEVLKKTWRSPIYSFFKSSVLVQYENGRPSHFSPCATRKCKTKAGGVHRFLDKKVCFFSYFDCSIVDVKSYRIDHRLPTFVIMPSDALGMKRSKSLKVHLHLQRATPSLLHLPYKGVNLFILPTVHILIPKFGE